MSIHVEMLQYSINLCQLHKLRKLHKWRKLRKLPHLRNRLQVLKQLWRLWFFPKGDEPTFQITLQVCFRTPLTPPFFLSTWDPCGGWQHSNKNESTEETQWQTKCLQYVILGWHVCPYKRTPDPDADHTTQTVPAPDKVQGIEKRQQWLRDALSTLGTVAHVICGYTYPSMANHGSFFCSNILQIV